MLVKVIVSQDESVRDQVIRATNNQSSVEPAALHATDQIQRSIEEILLRHDWYYERRTNFYKNDERPEGRILSPLVMAVGAVALLLRNPAGSSKFRQKNLRAPEAYNSVYSDTFPLNAWPVVAALIRGAENAINRNNKGKRSSTGKYTSAWRGVLAFLVAARAVGNFEFGHHDLIGINLESMSDQFINECWVVALSVSVSKTTFKVTDAQVLQIASAFEAKWGVKGNPLQAKRVIAGPPKVVKQESEETLQLVHGALPTQPWKPGTHTQVAAKLGITPFRAQRAINALIDRGLWLRQKDGILFDKSGREVGRDVGRDVERVGERDSPFVGNAETPPV